MNKRKIAIMGLVCLMISTFFTNFTMPTNVQAYETATQNQNQNGKTGALEPNEQQKEWLKNNSVQINSTDDLKKYENSSSNASSNQGNNGGITAAASSDSIPSKVDNSTSKYFPSIVMQAGQSCTSYSLTDYCMSYMVNKALNRSATIDNTMSPNWTFNLTNGGINQGTDPVSCMQILKRIGCVTNSQLDSAPSSLPSNYFTDYHAGGNLYKDAKKYQIDVIFDQEFAKVSERTPITSNKDTDLDTMKRMLNEGSIFSFICRFGRFNYVKLVNTKYAGEDSVYSVDKDAKDSWHEMTIVGYDDDIWTDINQNGKVEEEEKGALKVANSHGVEYGNKGYIWIAYDALNQISSVKGVTSSPNRFPAIYNNELYTFTIKSDEKVNSDVYLEVDMNSNMRNSLKLDVTDGSGAESVTNIEPFNGKDGGAYGFDGNTNYGDGKFSFNLTAYDKKYTSEYVKEKGIKVKVTDTKADDNSVHYYI